MLLILDDYGISLERENASFLLINGDEKRQISPERITAIHVRKPCSISSPAILLAAAHDLPLLVFDASGKVKARLWQTHFGSHVQIRHGQLDFARQPEGLAWVRQCLQEKAEGQAAVLRWLAQQVPAQAEALRNAAERLASDARQLARLPTDPVLLRSAEAQASRMYWQAFFQALDQYEAADKRSRRPAQDPLNALLNYAYGMLYGEVETATLSVGLDPHCGILHRNEHGRAAFVFDAIEPFRPWVDRLIAELVITRAIQHSWFEAKAKQPDAPTPGTDPSTRADAGVWLAKEGKKGLIPAYLAMMETTDTRSGKRVKRKDQVLARLSALAQDLRQAQASSTNEIDHDTQ
jgi:CRISP-associated protein Cas1